MLLISKSFVTYKRFCLKCLHDSKQGIFKFFVASECRSAYGFVSCSFTKART